MTPIRILGICGSPRKGNSQYLLERALEGAASLQRVRTQNEVYSIRGKTFHPCIACSHCAEHAGECVHRDDFDELRNRWLNADVILYSVPVYHMSIPGQLKCFIDRLGNSTFGRFRQTMAAAEETLPKLFKVIGAITQGMHLSSGQEHTLTDLINHALVMQSIPVTGDIWESYIGAGGWTLNDPRRDALEGLVREGEKGAEAAVRAARSVGRRATELALIVRSGLRDCREILADQPIYRPLFSRLSGTEI